MKADKLNKAISLIRPADSITYRLKAQYGRTKMPHILY